MKRNFCCRNCCGNLTQTLYSEVGRQQSSTLYKVRELGMNQQKKYLVNGYVNETQLLRPWNTIVSSMKRNRYVHERPFENIKKSF